MRSGHPVRESGSGCGSYEVAAALLKQTCQQEMATAVDMFKGVHQAHGPEQLQP